MLDTLFLLILNMSFTASIVIVFALFVRLLLIKVPKIFSYLLWSVVLFRLVCPFSFESSISLLGPKAIADDFMYSQVQKGNTGIPSINGNINAALPAATAYTSISPLQVWVFLGRTVWLAGIIALLVYSVVSFLHLRLRLKDSVHEKDNFFVSESLAAPFVMGLLHPKIYLPANLTRTEKQYIILHEQTHIKRLDHLIKILSFYILCLHWFNPLVWAAFFISGRDMEMSCDERVIKTLGSEAKKDYSSLLLTFATEKRSVGGTPLAFGEGNTKSRIMNVLNYKKPAFLVIAVSVIAVIAFAICLLSNPKDSNDIPFGSSAKDIVNQYTLALAASDPARMRQLTPALNPPAQEVIDDWRQIKIERVDILHEDIRENKAVFELSVTVKEAPDDFEMFTPGTAAHYLYAEKCNNGWYVESCSMDRRSQSDLETWWNQPNLISENNLPSQREMHPVLLIDENLHFNSNTDSFLQLCGVHL